MNDPKRQNIVRQISSCLTKKYNGFQVISIEFARNGKKNQQKIQKLVHFVILQKIFQKHMQIFTIKKIKLNALIVAMNAIADSSF